MKHPVFEVLGKDAGKLCQLRRDFRNFRLDRIAAPAMLDETFEDEAGSRSATCWRATDPTRSG
jgi:predicted DNA-binding transcriptional regulator YafY